MNTYESTKILIETRNYEKESMLKRLDTFLNFNRITLEQYTELVNTTWDSIFKVILDALKNPYVLGLAFISLWNNTINPVTKGITD